LLSFQQEKICQFASAILLRALGTIPLESLHCPVCETGVSILWEQKGLLDRSGARQGSCNLLLYGKRSMPTTILLLFQYIAERNSLSGRHIAAPLF
jgi:hypothetical protein